MFNGTNAAGGEIDWQSGNTANPISGTNYLFISHQDIDYIASKGMNFIRLVFSWEVMQPSLNGPLSTNNYANDFFDRVNYITVTKGLYCLIEPHGASSANFARYKGNLIGSSAVPNSAFANFWGQMAAKFVSNPKVFIGLSNEPNSMSTMQWFSAAQAAITAIRNAGFNNTIFCPGNGWTAADSWTSTWYDTASPQVSNATAWKTLNDPKNNLVASVHNYADSDGSGGSSSIVSSTILADRLANTVNWAAANGVKVHMSEFAVAGSNSLAQLTVNNAVNYMNNNSSTVIGASWWTYGPISWWGNYQFSLCPTNNYTTNSTQMGLLANSNFLQSAPAPTPTPTPTVTYDSNGFFHLNSGQSVYVGYKPDTYNSLVPISLFVWMHGCGGNAEGDLWNIAPPSTRSNQSYIAISIGGRDGACWDVNVDTSKVLAAITDVSKYFNINPQKIYLGGYSSGGDLTYRVAFYNAKIFAGVLVENSTPFRDTGSSQAASLSAATWKFNVGHLAHLQDTTYPITTVRNETDAMTAAGFPIIRIEKNGTHWDNDTATSGTNYDLIHSLLPLLDVGWMSPGAIPIPPPPPSSFPDIVPTFVTNKMPGDQGFSSSKTVSVGYNIPAGTYTLKANTKTIYSDQTSVCVDIILENDHTNVDLTWKSITIDFRGHTFNNVWNATVINTSGTAVTFAPNPGAEKVFAQNKNNFGFCFTRMSNSLTANYQVLVKSINW